MIAFYILLALIVLLGGSMCYIVATISREEKAVALRRREQSFEEVPMSWSRRIEGDVEAVIAKIEKEAEFLFAAAAEKVRAFEADLVKGLKASFGVVGGKKLSVKVVSDGHFDADGTGIASIQITSTAIDAPVTASADETGKEEVPA
jgi:hypothetical protein